MDTTIKHQVGSNAERTRVHNRRVVLDHVRTYQPVGRATIARASNLSIQAVSNIIAELVAEGWLHEVGRHIAGRGLPAVHYAVNPDGAAALGIEIRPDAIVISLVNLAGQALFSDRVALADSQPVVVAKLLQTLQRKALSKAGVAESTLLGAGIVMPGPFGRVGLSNVGQLAWLGWEKTDPQQLFEDALGIPVKVENDAIAAAIGERVCGTATDMKHYAFIYFGSGVGLGVVANGHVLRGAFGNAGELGHVVMQRDGQACVCGNRGCLKTIVSRLAVHKLLARHDIQVDGGADLERLLHEANPHLMRWLEQATAPLAQAIGMIENLFDPEAVILGGAMPDCLLDKLIHDMELPVGSIAHRPDRTTPRVLRGASGRMSATLGGAALIINESFTPRFSATE